MESKIEIQCDCGQFKAEIKNFPKETPGRLGCYCDDCQSYAIFLKRTDILDQAGCTEVVPTYPGNINFKQGSENLICYRLSEKGMYRWSTTCCNSPIANTSPASPWVGLHARIFLQKDKNYLQTSLGAVRARIMGKFAKAKPEIGTANKMNFKGIVTVLPFLLKGQILKKWKDSPFFQEDGVTPIKKPHVLTSQDLSSLKAEFESAKSY